MDQRDSRVPPQSNESEQAVLGAIMLENNCLADVLSILPESKVFFTPAHQTIFETMVILNQCRLPVDILTVAEELDRMDEIDNCGGRSYIAALRGGVATAVNVTHYARLVLEKYHYRKMIDLGGNLVQSAFSQRNKPEEIANKGAIDLYTVIHSGEERLIQPVSEIVPNVISYLGDIADGKITPGLMTEFTDLDAIIAGFQKGELIIVGARPSVGKTAFMTCCAINIARRDIPVLFISAETSKEELVLRMICTHGGFDSIALKRGGANDKWDQLVPVMNDIASLPFYIEDTPRIDISTLVAKINNFHKSGKADIVFIDHLQKLTMKNTKMPRWEQIGYFSSTLKALTLDLDIPIVLASQLSPKIDERRDHRPRLSDGREGHNVEQDCDTWLGIYRPLIYANKKEKLTHVYDNVAEVIVLKQRNGPTGTAELYFNKTFTRFENQDITPF